MADTETKDGGHVDQMELASNYLSEYEEVEDDYEKVIEDAQLQDEQDEIDKQFQKTPEDGKKKEEGKDDKKETDEKGKDTQKKLSDLKEIPKGFIGSFFNQDEKEGISFLHDNALKFTLPEDGKQRFNYQAGRKLVESAETDKPKTQEEIEAEAFQKEKEYRDSVKKQRYFGLTQLVDDINKDGLMTPQLQDYIRNAASKIQEELNTEFEERDLKSRLSIKDELKKEFGSEKTYTEAKKDAESNIRALVNELGSEFGIKDFGKSFEKFTALMDHGKHITNYLFDLMNPEYMEGHTKKQVSEALDKWWYTKIANNPQTLNFVYTMIRNSLTCELAPYMLEQHQAKNDTLLKQNQRGSRRGPSNIHRKAPSEAGGVVNDTLRYFGRAGGVDDMT